MWGQLTWSWFSGENHGRELAGVRRLLPTHFTPSWRADRQRFARSGVGARSAAGAVRRALRDDGLLGGSLMPLALLFRVLSRVLLVLGVVFLRRRARGGARSSVPPPYRTPGTGTGGSAPPPGWLRAIAAGTWLGRRMPDGVEGARLAGVALSLAAFGSAAIVVATAGTTLATLGPRWVGAVLLVLATLLAVAALREAVWLRRAVVLRRRRRRAEDLLTDGSEQPLP